MNTARVFQSGNSQAVRLPKAFRFNSEEVEIYKRGDEVILREKRKTMASFIEALMRIPEEVFPAVRHDPPPEAINFDDEVIAKPKKARHK